jgi:hypothetical protein
MAPYLFLFYNKIYIAGRRNKCMNKKANLTTGFIIRLFGIFVIVLSLPFLIEENPHLAATIAFGFGNFLLLLGAQLK